MSIKNPVKARSAKIGSVKVSLSIAFIISFVYTPIFDKVFAAEDLKKETIDAKKTKAETLKTKEVKIKEVRVKEVKTKEVKMKKGEIEMNKDKELKGIFNPVVKTLQNGMKVIIVKNGIAPIVDIGIMYNLGSADDPEDKIGLAHFLEHMMFTGTKSIPESEFKKIIRRIGGYSNAFTSYDFTVYENRVASEYLDLVLKLEADRMKNLTFTEEKVKSERNVVMEERRMRLENEPLGEALEVFLRAQNLYHPYGVPVIGYPSHIANYSYDSTRKHYDTWYAPNNATIVICGKVDPDEVITLVNKYFGDIKPTKLPERKRVQNPKMTGLQQKIVNKNPRSSMTMAWYSYKPISFSGENGKYFFPTIVLEKILASSTSNLYRHFVEHKKLALSISADFNDYSFDETPFMIEAVLMPNVKMEDFQKEYNSYIENLLKQGVDEEDFIQAKNDILRPFSFIKDGNDKVIMHYLGLACKFDLETLENWKEKIDQVTIKEVNESMRFILKGSYNVLMEVYPETKID